jgi:hypothetical protein
MKKDYSLQGLLYKNEGRMGEEEKRRNRIRFFSVELCATSVYLSVSS